MTYPPLETANVFQQPETLASRISLSGGFLKPQRVLLTMLYEYCWAFPVIEKLVVDDLQRLGLAQVRILSPAIFI